MADETPERVDKAIRFQDNDPIYQAVTARAERLCQSWSEAARGLLRRGIMGTKEEVILGDATDSN